MTFFARMAIRSRLRLLFVLLSGLLVTAVLVSYAVLETRITRERMAMQYGQIATMTAMSTRAAVAFGDAAFAERLIAGAQSGAGVEAVLIFDGLGELLSGSAVPGAIDPSRYRPRSGEGESVRFTEPLLTATAPVVLEGDVIGHVVVLANYMELDASLENLGLVVLLSLLACLTCAYLISIPMERLLLQPIARLGEEMASVRNDANYDRRLEHEGQDEVGDLYARFNEMLKEIDSRDRYINDERGRLEIEVRERTQDLTTTNETLADNVEQLKTANAAALAAARSKAEFLANMSHEIRTPMNGVLGMLELVRGTKLDAEQRDCVETAHRSGQGLLTLINDILDLSRIEAGKLTIDRTLTRPSDLVEEVCAVLMQQASSKGLQLVPVLEAPCYDPVQVDPARLRQILLNLTGNAVKFTHEGSVRVLGRIVADGDQEALELAIEDTGIGISAEAIERLFDSFTQADSSTTREYGGTGLGLAISRQLAELMEGTLDCTSAEGRGSRFTLTLPISGRETNDATSQDYDPLPVREVCVQLQDPLERAGLKGLMQHLGLKDAASADTVITDQLDYSADPKRTVIVAVSSGEVPLSADHLALYRPLKREAFLRALAGEGSAHGGSAKRRLERPQFPDARLLVAEDNPVNQVVVRKILATFGIQCELAENGEAAIELCRHNRFDLVLMDCQMPRLDGYETTKYLRRLEAEVGAPRMPIVALTANVMEGDADRCLQAGMDGYLAKPIEADALAAALERWLVVRAPHCDSVASEAPNRLPDPGDSQRRDDGNRGAYEH